MKIWHKVVELWTKHPQHTYVICKPFLWKSVANHNPMLTAPLMPIDKLFSLRADEFFHPRAHKRCQGTRERERERERRAAASAKMARYIWFACGKGAWRAGGNRTHCLKLFAPRNMCECSPKGDLNLRRWGHIHRWERRRSLRCTSARRMLFHR